MLLLVPNHVRDAINAAIDAALVECPDAAQERDQFYETLLAYFNEHGRIPDFSIQPKDQRHG